MTLKIEDMNFDSLPAAVTTGTVDIIISGMTINAERDKIMDYSQPYYIANQSVIVSEESDKKLTVLFGDNNIGVQTSTTGDIWVTDNLKKQDILKGRVSRYDTYILAVTDLINGNVDAIVLDSPVARKFTEIRPVKMVGTIFTHEEYGIYVNEGRTDILEEINAGINKLRDSGKIDELAAKYFQ